MVLMPGHSLASSASGSPAFSTGDLLLGTSTAAVQIEGGDRNNNWYDWAQIPGTIKDGSSPVRAGEHWNRWREDTELMATMGLQIYRMSLEWARIEPRIGEFDDAALERYRHEIELMKARGIKPLVSLHHFTNPSWFQQIGEFTNPRSVAIFLRYIRVVVEALGDVVSDWCTVNEPNVYATQAYLFKEAPPGIVSWPKMRAVLRNMAEAHCQAYKLIHEIQPDAMVGFAHHVRVFEPLNQRNPLHQGLTRMNSFLFQDGLTSAMLDGRFPTILGQPEGVSSGTYYDYLGINYYSRTAVSKIDDGTFPDSDVNDLGWEIYPDGLINLARKLHDKHPAPIWVTENGTCDNTDAFRSRFIYDQLKAISTSGLPFERYYHWCFIDNWEWNLGEAARFGIVHLDYETQERTIKKSGQFYSEIIANQGVTEKMYDKYVAAQAYPKVTPE